MIIGAVIVGILICILIILSFHISNNSTEDFDIGVIIGYFMTILVIIEVYLLSNIIGKPTPSAIDVYQGKTTIEYTIRDGVKVDSVVVFKKELQ